MVGAHHLGCRVPGQLFHGPVPMGDHMFLVENKGGNGAALDNLGQCPAALFYLPGVSCTLGLGLFFLRGVPEGFNGTDDTAIGGPDGRSGEKKPLAPFAQLVEEHLRLVGTVDQL